MASKCGDHQSLNHALLALWAGNQRGHAHLAAFLPPAELNLAIKEDRIRLVVEAGA
ncbi:hypothetical protein [Paenarthrobacter sp. C1]|uniref:hypothetical protein n=1 Tax=Paenarthrobacter sp. C1 TaxID=3400220 RepID=UPI003BF5A942